MERHNKRFLPNYSSTAINEMQKGRGAVLLPLASIEQHGPHLPVYTDSLIAMEVLGRAFDLLPENAPLWYLPLFPYGRSIEHRGFSGTITLTSETLMKVLSEIAESVSRSGFRRLIILNAHGGNSELVDVVMRDIREKTGLLVFGLHIYLRVAIPQAGLSDLEAVYGIHAGDIETSILLKSHPDLVNLKLAPDSIPHFLIKKGSPPFAHALNYAWLTRDISLDGVLGNAQTADAGRGKKYLEDAAKETADLIMKIIDFDFNTP